MSQSSQEAQIPLPEAIKRAVRLHRDGQLVEAERLYGLILESAPNNDKVLTNRGSVLKSLQRHDEALADYDRALAVNPNNVATLYNRGNLLGELRRYEDAIRSYDRALVLDPGNAEAFYNRGNMLRDCKRYQEAVASYDQALALDPRHASAHNNRGLSLKDLGRCDEALRSYERALAIRPGDVEVLANRGGTLQGLKRYDEALASFDEALAINPDHANAKWNKSLLQLSLGRLREGWELYESRLDLESKRPELRAYPQPRWDGGRVEGTLLVWSEQGLGDQILFSSMIGEVAARAESVVLEVEPRLVKLFARSFPRVQVIALRQQIYDGRVDAQVPLGSLGKTLRSSWEVFPRRGYLRADETLSARLRHRLAQGKERVIGLSWKSQNAAVGHLKSAQLSDFEPLLRMPGCRFVDLQYGDTLAERETLKRHLGLHVERLTDIDNTNDIDGLAALITACDVVVTVSNTAAHLAGALGKPTWVLVPDGPGQFWYWFRDLDDSPWYPRVRIRRRGREQPWASLMPSVAEEVSVIDELP